MKGEATFDGKDYGVCRKEGYRFKTNGIHEFKINFLFHFS